MKLYKASLFQNALWLALTLTVFGPAVAEPPADPGWPRVFKKEKKQLTVYQPQVDYWNGYTNMHFRCAIAVKGVTKQERFGVGEVDAVTVVDQTARILALLPTHREVRFPNCTDSELAALRRAVDELKPPDQAVTLSLDRVLAYLNPAEQPVQRTVEVSLDPPKIFTSTTPALLVIFMGEPQFKPVETNRTDVLFALNTNWDILYDTASGLYYLLNGDGWLSAPDVLKGPWTPARAVPPSFYSLPKTENWAEVRKCLPGKAAKKAPRVFATTEPAELIVTDGAPSYMPVRGTKLLRANNTESVLFLHSGDGKLYFLVAGRWFRGDSLDGPWTAASKDLPPDFGQIPDDNPAAYVKASVPGTREAQDAVLLASVPTTTTVSITNVPVNVTYNGAPQFVAIPSTTVEYAVNTPNQVFLVNGGYYWCLSGAWLCGATANGPWSYCTSVPSAIYTIPPSHPNYNVTYVVVQSATPTTVVYSQTSGYSGEYVAASGVLMFGMGMLVGAAIADHHDYYYPAPIHYSYGCGAIYNHGYGGYYSSARVYGPYGGAGRTASYNPYTGTYARSSYAYGPYGSASRSAAYNPYTGARAAGGQIHTPYGSAGRFGAYNPSTGNAAWGGYRSGEQGTVGAIRTSQGSGMAAWNTEHGQGAVGRTRSGDIYASNGNTVYRRDSNGSWSQNSGSGWESTSKPQPAAQAGTTRARSSWEAQPRATTASSSSGSGGWTQNRQSLESQAQARSWGNRQASQSSSSRSGSGWRGQSGGGRSFRGRR